MDISVSEIIQLDHAVGHLRNFVQGSNAESDEVKFMVAKIAKMGRNDIVSLRMSISRLDAFVDKLKGFPIRTGEESSTVAKKTGPAV